MTKTTTKPAAVDGAVNAAVLSERMRVSAILESREGRRNPAMANELALRTALDVETARSILARAPAANPFTEAMNHQGPINLGEGIGANVATFNGADNAKAARLKEIEVSVEAFNVSNRGTARRAPRARG
jgi:hypothetical protein